MNTLRTLCRATRALPTRANTFASRSFASSSSAPSPASSSQQTPPAASTSSAPAPPTLDASFSSPAAPSHYLVTLLRSPLHLPKSTLASIRSLGLGKRLSSAIVPISQTNAGYILALKELVGVRTVTQDQVKQWASPEWRARAGEGKKGAGMRIRADATRDSVIRVGSERARGDERGFRAL
ncbi:hypothetical protein JCM10207_005495 [Rhodosporidiobolus poonsookiae]